MSAQPFLQVPGGWQQPAVLITSTRMLMRMLCRVVRLWCRWLSTQLEDGRICRDLVGGASRPQIAYQVVTYTSDIRGASTDAVVSIQLHGLLGDGHKQQLLGGPTDFDR